MTNKYSLAASVEMDKRKLLADEFYTILDPEEIPYIVTDEASLYDIYAGNELELIRKIKNKYGVDIDIKGFKIPFWKLLDLLDKNRKRA